MALTFATILINLMLISFLCLAIYGMIILLRRYDYTREYFALLALSAITTLTVTLAASLATNLMPWHVQAAISQVLSGQEIDVPEVLWAEQILLVSLVAMVIWSIVRLHRSWHGVKSAAQYRREQNSEAPSLLFEGLDEFWRLIKRQGARELYSKPDWRDFIAPLESVTDSLTWPEQARELLCLSSSAYAFDSPSAWHEKGGCWVGKNLDSDQLAFLYPAQAALSESEIKTFVDYANKIAVQQNKAHTELIIVSKDYVARLLTKRYRRAIRVETESTLLDNLVDFRHYENHIYKRVLVDRLPDSNLALEQVYVPSHFKLPDGQKATQNIEQYLRKWLLEPGQRQLALLGEYGEGKSTAAHMLTYHLLQQGPPTRFPILIELRGMSPRNLTPLELLGAWAACHKIEPQALMRLLIAGRLLLIFEGFDEVTLVGDAEMRLNHFKTLWQFSYPQAKILFTGRPNFFLDDQEMKAALGISKPVSDQESDQEMKAASGISKPVSNQEMKAVLRISKPVNNDRPYCEVIRLAPFELWQIKKLLWAHQPLVRSQICALAEYNHGFKELISRPSLLHIVSVLWEREKLSEKAEQLNSAYVMKLFVEHSYRRQALKKLDARRNFMALTTSERDYFMSGVASYMAANQLPNQISGTELNQLIEALIEAIPDAVSTDPSAIGGETTPPLRQRLAETPDRIKHVKTDVRACGLLVDDPATPGTFRFGHKSFLEYLFAAVLAEHIVEESSAKARAILKATNAKIEDILHLSVSVEFLAELIATVHKNHTSSTSIRKQDKQAGSEYYVAKKLFNSLLNINNKFSLFLNFNKKYTYISLNMYFDMYIKNISFIFLLNAFVLTTNSLLILTESIGYYLGLIPFLIKISFFLILPLTSYFLLHLTYFLTFEFINLVIDIYAFFFYNEKSKFWENICNKMEIQNDVLHRVVQKWMLP